MSISSGRIHEVAASHPRFAVALAIFKQLVESGDAKASEIISTSILPVEVSAQDVEYWLTPNATKSKAFFKQWRQRAEAMPQETVPVVYTWSSSGDRKTQWTLKLSTASGAATDPAKQGMTLEFIKAGDTWEVSRASVE